MSRELPLYKNIAATLMRQIRSGKLAPGARAPSERNLAMQWNISRGTARLALQELEKSGFLGRYGAQGSFIRLPEENRVRRAVFAFPEEAISPLLLLPENWGIASEIHRGLLAGGVEAGIQVNFEYFPEHVSETERKNQLKHLEEYDAIFFTGPQLLDLMTELAPRRTVFNFTDDAESLRGSGIIPLDYDHDDAVQKLASHAKAIGAHTFGTVTVIAELLPRAERFADATTALGLKNRPEHCWVEVGDRSDRNDWLREKLSGTLPDFLFCNDAELIVQLYAAAEELGLRPGRDFAVAGIMTGFTIRGLIPTYTYIRTPHFEVARAAMAAFAAGQREIELCRAELIVGNSTQRGKE